MFIHIILCVHMWVNCFILALNLSFHILPLSFGLVPVLLVPLEPLAPPLPVVLPVPLEPPVLPVLLEPPVLLALLAPGSFELLCCSPLLFFPFPFPLPEKYEITVYFEFCC